MDCTVISSNDGAWGSVLSCRTVTARKEHVCCECRRKINRKERYERYKVVYDGEISEFKTCIDCISLRNAVFNSWVFRCIWDDFYEYVSEGYGEELKWSAISMLTETAKDMAFRCIETVWERVEEDEDDE